MKIKLAKALKMKKRMALDLADLLSKNQRQNTYVEGNPPLKPTTELLGEYEQKLAKYIEFKTKIQIANAPIFSKIFELAETKGYLQGLNRFQTDIDNSYMQPGQKEKRSSMSTIEKEELIKLAKDKIEKLQDELDAFNATTEIEIAD
jgi:hypothetical protein